MISRRLRSTLVRGPRRKQLPENSDGWNTPDPLKTPSLSLFSGRTRRTNCCGRANPHRGASLPGLIQGEAEKPIRDVHTRFSEGLQNVGDGRDDSEPVTSQDQTDGADARDPQPGRLTACGMVVEHRLPTRMIEGHGEDGDLSGVENTDSEKCMNRGRRSDTLPGLKPHSFSE